MWKLYLVQTYKLEAAIISIIILVHKKLIMVFGLLRGHIIYLQVHKDCEATKLYTCRYNDWEATK